MGEREEHPQILLEQDLLYFFILHKGGYKAFCGINVGLEIPQPAVTLVVIFENPGKSPEFKYKDLTAKIITGFLSHHHA